MRAELDKRALKWLDVPLVFNEMGVMADPASYDDEAWGVKAESGLTTAQRMQNELTFWDSILKNAKDYGIGVAPYYWMQTGVWGGWEALVSTATWSASASSPTPTQTGQIFIDNYVTSPSPTPTPTPTPSPTPRPTPIATPTPTPSPTPSPTPQPTTTPSPTPTPTTRPTPTQTPTAKPTPTPSPTPAPTSTPANSTSAPTPT